MFHQLIRNFLFTVGTLSLFIGYAPGFAFGQEVSDPVIANYLRTLQRRAETGDPKAEYIFGNIYWHGIGVAQDYTKAVYWIEKAAMRGYTKAGAALGLAYASGMGDKKVDYVKANELFRRAALKGNSYGEEHLGRAYYRGAGVDQDYQLAKYWLEKAVAQGNGIAESLLGLMYERGKGVEQNKALALELYQKSCSHKYEGGCENYDALKDALK